MVHTVSADFEYMERLDFQSLALSRKNELDCLSVAET